MFSVSISRASLICVLFVLQYANRLILGLRSSDDDFFLAFFALDLGEFSFLSYFTDTDELGVNRYRYRKYRLRYRYMKVKIGRRQKSVPNLYLRSFGSENSVPVPSTICLFLTTGFI
ncbi:hypothetical protein Hanom_Chr03g00229571 [Helianthus anomalus]